MTIKEFGGKVASVWEGLRPVTQKMLVGALKAGEASTPQSHKNHYDAHADWEVSRLLSALDEQSTTSETRKDAAKLNEIKELAETCARVLEAQSASAEVFIQLATRAIKENDYRRLDRLADTLSERYSSTEVAEIVRQTEMPQIRAIAYETLAMMPVGAIVPLLDDPLYSGIGAAALEQKAFEFDSDEARDVLDQYDNGQIGEA
ncbi:MAG TPA: hypothetical protein VL501_04340 [Pyrinomonadaceae bacterium]|nr:hypothetical protein [Pyrinomonadaceae bacterium]